ncbi:MAG: ATP-binding protein, partial [Elusimicrobiota bacterium]|nr:ATP-binding protein [Endomicrobiia bacterium]MDW8166495.1 ATP-binding protein [Elusimicrobiota bacterium]
MIKFLFLKTLKISVFTTFILFLILVFLFKEISRKIYIYTLTEKIKGINSIIISEILTKEDDINKVAEKFVKELNVRFEIINPKNATFPQNYLNPYQIKNILKKSFESFISHNTLYVATSFKKNSENYILLSIYDLEKIEEALSEKISFLFVVKFIPIIFLTLTIVLFWVVFSYNKKLKFFLKSFQKVKSGNFDAEVYFDKKDEFKNLSEIYNEMLEKIKTTIKEVSFQTHKIKQVFSSIQEAIVLLDNTGRILLYNEKFLKLCKISPEKRYYWEALISLEFNDIIKTAIQNKQNILKEINIFDKTYLCSISFISATELVVFLYDITQHKQIQDIKKDLVLNIIHELKTPLTSIKGFVETLYNEINKKQHKHYLKIILSNTERLIKIINDLTTLAQLEQKEIKPYLEEVNLYEVVEDIKSLFEQKAKEKNLEMKIELQDGLRAIKADRSHIEQLLINLLDNAIRYTDKGYIKLKISQDITHTYIEVEDTGIGISKEYHSRIFERFFVVDKARSRQTGGTGLGL